MQLQNFRSSVDCCVILQYDAGKMDDGQVVQKFRDRLEDNLIEFRKNLQNLNKRLWDFVIAVQTKTLQQ